MDFEKAELITKAYLEYQPKFYIGETVYLVTDPDQDERLITQVCFKPNNLIHYCTSANGRDIWVYDFEITDEKDVIKSTSN